MFGRTGSETVDADAFVVDAVTACYDLTRVAGGRGGGVGKGRCCHGHGENAEDGCELHFAGALVKARD